MTEKKHESAGRKRVRQVAKFLTTTAQGSSEQRIADLQAHLTAAEARYQAESLIVDHVWAALGISTFEQANGKDIATIVSELRRESAALREALQNQISIWKQEAIAGNVDEEVFKNECADELAALVETR